MSAPWPAVRAGRLLALVALAGCNGGGSGEAADEATALSFADVTASSGVDVRITSGATPPTQIPEVKGGGLALLDGDGDGDLDLFVPNGATLEAPDRGPGARYFENRGSLEFTDATEQAEIRFRGWGMGVSVGDGDGDGAEDLFVAAFGENAWLVNSGSATFADRTRAAGLSHPGWGMASSFGDLDGDGDLDLYLANYLEFDLASPPGTTSFLGVEVFSGPAGLPPAADRCYENLGDGSFQEVTARAGMRSVPPAFGLGVVILDFDGDGLQDVFVGNDSMPNYLFVGQGGFTFVDRGLPSGIACNADGGAQATMGIAVADVDGDGRPDVFTSNFASDTNTLHVNRGGTFIDRTQSYRLGMVSRTFLGWSSLFGDYDLDGDEDLVVFNGHVYPESVTRELGTDRAQVPLLFERSGSVFERVEDEAAGAWLFKAHVDRSAAQGDLDGDGDLDLVVGELNGPVRLLENRGARGAWLAVSLSDPGSANPRGLGAVVTLEAAGERQVRWLASGLGYQSASPAVAHFGLGAFEGECRVVVRWPDGQETTAQAAIAPGSGQQLVLSR